MTDRHMAYVVTLVTDIREDDADAIITALRMVKGVLSVEPVIAELDAADHVVRERSRKELKEMMWKVYQQIDTVAEDSR